MEGAKVNVVMEYIVAPLGRTGPRAKAEGICNPLGGWHSRIYRLCLSAFGRVDPVAPEWRCSRSRPRGIPKRGG